MEEGTDFSARFYFLVIHYSFSDDLVHNMKHCCYLRMDLSS